MILPARLCRDGQLRAALEHVRASIDDPRLSMSDRRRAVQAALDDAFGADLKIAQRRAIYDGFIPELPGAAPVWWRRPTEQALDGYFALEAGPGLFRRLHESFDYVTDVVDNPAGTVRIAATARWRWRTYGELMQWYHELRGSHRNGVWSAFTPYFVCGNTAALHRHAADRWARPGLHRPAEEPPRWFVLRPGLADAQVRVRLEMKDYGWARLHLSLDDATLTIHLSEVFDPFGDLLGWGREIDEGDLPVQIEIDEEGRESVLTALRTDDPARVLLRVTRKYADQTLLEGIVARTALASALKSELRRFFESEFDPQHWDLQGDDLDRPCDYVQVKDRALNHAWLAKGR